MNFKLSFAILWLVVVTGMTSFIVFMGSIGAALILIPFWIIGFIILKEGLKKESENKATARKGKQTFGLVVDFSDSGSYVNGNAVWNVHVLVILDNGYSQVFVEEAGVNPLYDVGDFLTLKYYQNDINILEKSNKYEVPEYLQTTLLSIAPANVLETLTQQQSPAKSQPRDFIVTEDSIIVDGVAYPRPK